MDETKKIKTSVYLSMIVLMLMSALTAMGRDEKNVVFKEGGTWLYTYPTTWTQEEYVIPEGVLYIHRNAFTGTKVKRIVLPSTLLDIKQEAFYDSQVTTISLPGLPLKEGRAVLGGKNLIVGKRAFYGTKISELVIPDDITSLDEEAFGKLNLKSIQGIPFDQIEGILAKNVFSETTFSTLVLRPDFNFTNVKYFKYFNFRDISFSGTPKTCVVEDRMCLSPDRNKLLYVLPKQNEPILDIPASVKTIGSYAFISCGYSGNLGYVRIGENVRTIEPYAFAESSISAVRINSPQLTLGKCSFFRSRIQAIDISGTKLEELPDSTFMGMHGNTIILPETIRKCGTDCFDGWIDNTAEWCSEGRVMQVIAPSHNYIEGLISHGRENYHSANLEPLVASYMVVEDFLGSYHVQNEWVADNTGYYLLEDCLTPFVFMDCTRTGNKDYFENNSNNVCYAKVHSGGTYNLFGNCFNYGNVEPVSESWRIYPYKFGAENDEYLYASITQDGILTVYEVGSSDWKDRWFNCLYTVTDQFGHKYNTEICFSIYNEDNTYIENVKSDPDPIFSSYSFPYGVYDLYGRHCGATTDGLAKGLYIVSDERGVRKVMVK